MALSNDTVTRFIIGVQLIDPIEDILKKLENRQYRDCDIKWLDNKLAGFMEFAAQTFGLTISTPPKEPYITLNEYVINQYKERFTNLLNYFKSFLDD